ncbi:tRNA pseudouridine(55) synthase TruB [Neoehrlichia mikurensis]|uniref:tRNA pseudouridine synthase B n=1 Tax=Neoehrlichia mikurensis TaxID=89586 RepID=A0A9Q9BSM8_9RICK|nr:tRNA pseudouridine(55) synthase TruB [Neoehrlichia mikurensis]QXK92022.1 tRNA pseudouridine(55) synthase TruB [Neoehrlichia mikurensis]QXK92480.1 tRNA pseudouridine(55) synthase TruB [Neoehrlichia mikurensis]QXK93715.1 tRNA pseudouridine(55) synthase TruB [Neoehrlichia mikurensis]UTO55312.1 tRNA pseudouridine(55) synthase TruB [Neoehrlichia mikurensis]UTO56232.1 tRNA pseudouridine(55) synthase TruB [Neoehrlichia mikurensis]
MYGWINLDKPYGISSAGAVNKLKKIFHVKKAGHAGTLDPLATGVLPIAIGEATKVMSYAVNSVKSYTFTVQWGCQRSTDDAEGEIIDQSSFKPGYADIMEAMKKFQGVIKQIPPKFSAINVNGTRAYKIARKDFSSITLQPRFVRVIKMELISVDKKNNTSNFTVTCDKGLYVRSLARDLGIELGCFGYVLNLRRLRVGCFFEKDAVNLNELESLYNINKHNNIVLPLHCIMNNMPHVYISDEDMKKVKNGQNVQLNDLYVWEKYDMCYVSTGNIPVAVCSIIDKVIKPVRVFNV